MLRESVRSVLVLLAGALVSAGIATAQTKAAKPKPHLPTFDKHQLADLLAKKRTEVLAKMASDRIVKRGPKRVEKWLDKFQVVQSEHYLVYTNGPSRTVRRFAKTLEELYAYIRKRFPFEEVDAKLTAYVFNQEEEYFDFCTKIAGWSRRAAEGTAGHATAGYYATFYQSPRSNVVIHEATHQIVAAGLRAGGVGSWFQEGMAVYFENVFLNGKPSAEMRTNFRNGNFYELEDFIKIPTLLSDPRGHGTRNYEQAGALIDFLINSKQPEVKGKFPAFLAAARTSGYYGDGGAALIRQVYGLSVSELGQVWKRHHGVPDAKANGR